MKQKINIKNFFPNIPLKYFKAIQEALIEVGELKATRIVKILESWKKDYPKNWEDLAYQNITTKGANNIRKMTQSATEKTACGFMIKKVEEEFCAFETFLDMYGKKQGSEKFLEHIKRRREEFEYIQEKFPETKTITQKY